MLIHPIANIFPILNDTDLATLAADIQANGLIEPIWLTNDGQVLDGRNRLRACEIAGVVPAVRYYQGTEEGMLAFVVSLNLHRRHLEIGQRAAIASDLTTTRQGERTDLEPSAILRKVPVSQPEAAALMKVSPRSVQTFESVKRADPALAEQVKTGATTLKDAAREIRVVAAASHLAAIKASPVIDLGEIGPFQLVYADPPWRYEFSETDARKIENQYPTMSHNEICALKIPAAGDSVLFMWATVPKLTEALEVLVAWGFEYVTGMVWVKDRIGMGYYARSQHELILIGKRGALPVPPPEARPSSVITASRDEHSAKPDVVYDLLERMYPFATKVELFQRRPRKGWTGWGNQA